MQNSLRWHSKNINDVISHLESSQRGLSQQESLKRIQIFGKNELPKEKPPSLFLLYVHQFKSPLIYLLAVAAIISLIIKEYSDSIFIFGVLFLNSLIGVFQEWKAQKQGQALQKLIQVRSRVQRDDEILEVDAKELVPGDLVLLEAGSRVPADLRLKSINGLEIDESLLTGESVSILKNDSPVEKDAILANRYSMAYAGSMVTHGRGMGYVVETGINTEVGKLAHNVQKTKTGEAPLVIRMQSFVRTIMIVVTGFVTLLALYSIFIQGSGILEIFNFSVALAVSAIPEGLPIAMTVALAIATTKMSKKNVIVKNLSAVEGLGSCTMIATDKTGTLTCNELTIRKISDYLGREFEISGEGYVPNGEVYQNDSLYEHSSDETLKKIAIVGALCNEAYLNLKNSGWNWHGDPVDVAFLSLAHKLGHTKQAILEQFPLISQIPFEPERGFAASYHQQGENTLVFVKGSPEKVLSMCKVSKKQMTQIQEKLEKMARSGMKVMALAEGTEKKQLDKASMPSTPKSLEFISLLGMIDPPRAEAYEAVKTCHESGIHVAMLTGDHKLTGEAIAKELGIMKEGSKVYTGVEIEKMDEQELQNEIPSISVYARVSPIQKLKIVEASKKAGQFVAVTGDGVNDGPALKAANVGVAMGKSGTDVAREASDMIITDDKFSSIIDGIEDGRIAYDNIRKVIYLLISTGAGELVMVSLAIIFSLPIPLLPVQLLWLNLVTNGIQDVALAFETGEDGVIKRRPREVKEKIFNRLMIERTIVAAIVMGVVGISCFSWLLSTGKTESEARNLTLLLMVLFENIHIGNSRSETRSAFAISPLKSPILLIGTLSAFAIHMLVMNWEFSRQILYVGPVSFQEFIWLFIIACSLLIAMELHKLSWRARHPF